MTIEDTTKKRRPIDDLLKIDSYAKMTDEEIGRVIEYKAEIKARDAAYEARLTAIKKAGENMLVETTRQYEEAKATQNELLNISLARLKATMGDEK
jgi:roadblock/LC7 domain-containing protein